MLNSQYVRKWTSYGKRRKIQVCMKNWDLRFSSITYMPKKAGKVQLFTYKTKVVPILTIAGWGKSRCGPFPSLF